ncbi:hypothetical protein JNO54_02760 [Janibacter sp. YIM B02568]|uniref:hypothetical protein n=1 Tax=Janibacter endophyticus TaxID=2806261 RepID=UPI0019502376|nr:hypothetical protein [Janibacter endophyticus]MBM6545061.1 hypothetical protein [Janibacter endophyticus]
MGVAALLLITSWFVVLVSFAVDYLCKNARRQRLVLLQHRHRRRGDRGLHRQPQRERHLTLDRQPPTLSRVARGMMGA